MTPTIHPTDRHQSVGRTYVAEFLARNRCHPISSGWKFARVRQRIQTAPQQGYGELQLYVESAAAAASTSVGRGELEQFVECARRFRPVKPRWQVETEAHGAG